MARTRIADRAAGGLQVITPTEDDIGRKVIYTGNRKWDGPDEEGVVTSFNDHSIFVRYGSKAHSEGTRREDLIWASP